MFASKPFSCATETGINLVQNQQHLLLVADPAQHRQKSRWRNIDASPHLNWFNQDHADCLATKSLPNPSFDKMHRLNGGGKRNEMSKLSQLPDKRSAKMLAVGRVQSAITQTMVSAGK